MSDRIVAAIFGGIIGSILQTALGYIFYLTGLAKTNHLLMAGNFFLNESALNTTAGYIVGLLADLVMGGFLAVVFVYLISITGKDYWLLKALGYTGFVWVLGAGLLDRAFNIVPVLQEHALTNLLMFVTNIVYSVSMAYFVVRWGRFPSNIINQDYDDPDNR